MLIRCWGARGSIPVSGTEYKRYGGDTTCLEIRTKEDDVIIVDAGTGIRRLGSRLLKEKRLNLNIIFTHTHWDHVLGFPFFKPIYLPDTHIRIFGCPFEKPSIKEFIAPLLTHPYFPVSFEDIKAKIDYISVDKNSFSIGPMTVTPILLNHPNQGLGYKFTEDNRSFVFLTDNELTLKNGGLDYEDYVNFCSGADLLIHDAEYTQEDYKIKKGWGHSVYNDALQLALKAQVKYFGLFHHNQERSDEMVDGILNDCKKIIKDKKSDLECFASAQDMEIILRGDEPLSVAGVNEKDEDVQKNLAKMNNEIIQLKSTVGALRDELEKKQIEKEENVQQAKVSLNNEITQLKDTISAQRDTMTSSLIRYEEKLQELKLSAQNETGQLKDTITMLRDQLEGRNGK